MADLVTNAAYFDAEGRRRRSNRGFVPETANNTPEPTVNKKNLIKKKRLKRLVILQEILF